MTENQKRIEDKMKLHQRVLSIANLFHTSLTDNDRMVVIYTIAAVEALYEHRSELLTVDDGAMYPLLECDAVHRMSHAERLLWQRACHLYASAGPDAETAELLGCLDEYHREVMYEQMRIYTGGYDTHGASHRLRMTEAQQGELEYCISPRMRAALESGDYEHVEDDTLCDTLEEVVRIMVGVTEAEWHQWKEWREQQRAIKTAARGGTLDPTLAEVALPHEDRTLMRYYRSIVHELTNRIDEGWDA